MNRSQGSNRVQVQQESLAAFLARVRPGDSCACCGATLQPLARGSIAARVASNSTGPRVAAAVICGECGYEISEEIGLDAEEGRKRLSSAA